MKEGGGECPGGLQKLPNQNTLYIMKIGAIVPTAKQCLETSSQRQNFPPHSSSNHIILFSTSISSRVLLLQTDNTSRSPLEVLTQNLYNGRRKHQRKRQGEAKNKTKVQLPRGKCRTRQKQNQINNANKEPQNIISKKIKIK